MSDFKELTAVPQLATDYGWSLDLRDLFLRVREKEGGKGIVPFWNPKYSTAKRVCCQCIFRILNFGKGINQSPHVYKWLGTGVPWVGEQQTRNWPNGTYRTKKVEGHEQKKFPTRCAEPVPLPNFHFRAGPVTPPPTFKFVPEPLVSIDSCRQRL